MRHGDPERETSTGRDVLAGLVERVTFHSAESGFCVLRLKARGHRDLVTTVGHAATISAGEWVTASGEWVNDRTHGQQFRARFLKASAPSSLEGIEKYLGSGMVRGIGPVYARRMVKHFGKDVFDIIEATPERLREVEGIGPKRAGRITSAWADQKVIREIMVFLHEHGVGTARAVRIFKTYGTDAVQVVSENRGGVGARSLNIELQAVLNPAGDNRVERFGWTFAPGDKVMQTENDYDKEVYNGDIGYVDAVDLDEGEVTASFDGRSAAYGFGELDTLMPAYATTIHKSQGSEYPAVVIPILTQHYAMLQRNLLYTGVTRGRRLVVLVGQPKAVAIAVRNISIRGRWSKLDEWLMDLFQA